MRQILILFGIGALVGCLFGYNKKGGEAEDDKYVGETVSMEDSIFHDSMIQKSGFYSSTAEEDHEQIMREGPLNDIRFGDFDDEDWINNDYIRELRRYLDAYSNGEVKDRNLDPYRHIVKGRFVIGDVKPSTWGGLLIFFFFVDYPEFVFSSYVYSIVDAEKKRVVEYSVRYVKGEKEKDEYRMTKKEVLDSLKVHPEFKLW